MNKNNLILINNSTIINNSTSINNPDDSEVNVLIIIYISIGLFSLFACYYLHKKLYCKKTKKLSFNQIFPEEKTLIFNESV